MIRYIIVLFFLFGLFTLKAQKDSSLTKNKSIYIEKYDRLIGTKLSLNNDIEIFTVEAGDYKLILAPNTAVKTSLSVDYRFISFALSYAPEFLPGNNDDNSKGRSKIFSFGFMIQPGKIVQRAEIERIGGFYVQNTSDFIPDFEEYIQIPELIYSALQGSTGYNINSKYSLKAITSQTERQLKSAGTIIPELKYRYYVIDNQESIDGSVSSTQKSNNMEIIAQCKAYYTLILHKNWFLTGKISFGGGKIYSLLKTRFADGKYKTESNNTIWRGEGQLAFGYNTKRIFAGIEANLGHESYRQGKSTSTISNDGLFFQVFAGYRFDAPKVLDNTIDNVISKFSD